MSHRNQPFSSTHRFSNTARGLNQEGQQQQQLYRRASDEDRYCDFADEEGQNVVPNWEAGSRSTHAHTYADSRWPCAPLNPLEHAPEQSTAYPSQSTFNHRPPIFNRAAPTLHGEQPPLPSDIPYSNQPLPMGDGAWDTSSWNYHQTDDISDLPGLNASFNPGYIEGSSISASNPTMGMLDPLVQHEQTMVVPYQTTPLPLSIDYVYGPSAKIPRDGAGFILCPIGPGWEWITDLLCYFQNDPMWQWYSYASPWTDEFKACVWMYGPSDGSQIHPPGRSMVDPELRDRFDTPGFLHKMRFARVESLRFKLRGYTHPSRKLSREHEKRIRQAIKGMKAMGNNCSLSRRYLDIRRVYPEITNNEILEIRCSVQWWFLAVNKSLSTSGVLDFLLPYDFGTDSINGLAWILTAVEEGY